MYLSGRSLELVGAGVVGEEGRGVEEEREVGGECGRGRVWDFFFICILSL